MTSETYLVPTVTSPVRGTIRPPGSKSLTNRALICAALADGHSRLTGVLDSQDTHVMIDSLQRLGFTIMHDSQSANLQITGCAAQIPADSAELWLENSGTSIRFLTALCSLGQGTYLLRGNKRMSERPIKDLTDALAPLGSTAQCTAATGCPPVHIIESKFQGGRTAVAGSISSQFLSALLMVAPCGSQQTEIAVDGELVSKPYVDMTIGVMNKFGVTVHTDQGDLYRVGPQTYRPTEYSVEPDASAASYFLGAAAITGGEVTIEGLSRDALQGDVAFAEVLEQMGCEITWQSDAVTARGGSLHGIDVDMNAISDTAQTLAVVALFAEGPTRIRNIGHVRHKETDRLAALANEIRRLGGEADEHDDGITIYPGINNAATIATYDDHRMAMSFALAGLRFPGIRIADPDCTAKTYPRFFDDLLSLCDGNT